MTDEQRGAWFVYHAPTAETTPRYEEIRKMEEAAHVVVNHALNGAVWDDNEKAMRPATSMAERFDAVNRACGAFAVCVNTLAPHCDDADAAIRAIRLAKMYANEAIITGSTGINLSLCGHPQLREARFWANAAIACGGV